jgi:hypothetical protein
MRRAVKMVGTYELRFLMAFNGLFVPPIKNARDEQPNDRQWQSEDDKRYRGADKFCEHEYPPTSFSALQADRLSSKKSGEKPILPESASTTCASTPTSRPRGTVNRPFRPCDDPFYVGMLNGIRARATELC